MNFNRFISIRQKNIYTCLAFKFYPVYIVTYVLTLFSFSFSPFIFFAAVVDLLLGLQPVEQFPRKHHRDGQFSIARLDDAFSGIVPLVASPV